MQSTAMLSGSYLKLILPALVTLSASRRGHCFNTGRKFFFAKAEDFASRKSCGFELGASTALVSDVKKENACADVITVPMFSDNYGYIIVDRKTKIGMVVDPAEPEPVMEAARQNGVVIRALLNTHKHADHIGGNKHFISAIPDLDVVGPKAELRHIPNMNHQMVHGSTYALPGTSLLVRVLATPCHTRGHIVFYITNTDPSDAQDQQDQQDPLLFAGDTLFVGGCGRFFEGTAAEMKKNLMDTLSPASLPPNTQVYCAHEYTASNLAFALSVEPENDILQAKMDWVKKRRAQSLPTVPTTLGGERLINPFMRVDVPAVIGSTLGPNVAEKYTDGRLGDAEREEIEVEAMAKLREMKNSF